MTLDVRLPLGLLFIAIGMVLIVEGLGPINLSAAMVSSRIDLLWGLVLLGFGGVMTGLAAFARRRGKAPSVSPDADPASGDLPVS